MNPRMRRMLALALFLTAASEWLILFLLRGLGTTGEVSPGFEAGFFALLFAINAYGLPQARKRIHDTGPSLWFSRSFIIGSVTALMTGTILAGALTITAVTTLAFGISGEEQTAWLRGVGGVAAVLGVGAGLWGATVGNHRVRIDPLHISLKGMPADHPGLAIAHISDLHIGPLLRGRRLTHFVEHINGLEADLVVITGDIFDFDPRYVDEGCRALARLRAGHGVFAVLGNHDLYTGTERVVAGLRELTSIRLLRDSWERVEIAGQEIAIAGLDDPVDGWMDKHAEHDHLERVASEIPAELPRLLLVHRPSYFDHAEAHGFPLVLAGHTHGGQIALPFATNTNVARMISDRTRGLFAHGQSKMYVNRGLGMAGLPLRINCPREIALIQLSP